MPGEKPDVLLVGAKKPVIVGGLTNAVTLHPLEDAKDQDAFLNSIADKVRAIAVSLTAHKIDADLMQRLPEAGARLDLRRRLRPRRCQMGGRARHHRDQHAGRAQRRGCRHRARPAALDRARTAAGRALSARRQMAVGQLSADQHAARPHRRHGRHGTDRPGHRAADRGVRRAGRLSQPLRRSRA